MKLPPPPWRSLTPATTASRGVGALRLVALVAGAVALWAGLAAPRWQAGRRPALMVEAFLQPMATAAQSEELGRAAQGETWCCDIRFVSAEEARAEAAADARVRGLLEAFGANPLLRSWRITLCGAELERWRVAADWLRERPGVHSVRAPGTAAARALESEREALSLTAAGAWGLGVFALIAGLIAQVIAARALGPELGVYAMLGMTPVALRARAAWALLAPAVTGALAVALGCALASIGFQFGDVWGVPTLAALPAFPRDAAAWLAAAAAGAGIVAVLLARPAPPR